MGFFDEFRRFYSTSQTSPFPDRLNSRHEAIIAKNAPLFFGKRVLDIASHDGRWTFAALKSGASHVIGIEPRQELIRSARETFDFYDIPQERYDFRCGDVFDLIEGVQVDIVLCLGFYYHTIRHAELLDRIERTGARLVVIDTEVSPGAEFANSAPSGDPRIVYRNPYVIQLLRDPVDNQQMACKDSMTRSGYTLVGRPSKLAVEFIANHFCYKCELYDWRSHFGRNPEAAAAVVDYYER